MSEDSSGAEVVTDCLERPARWSRQANGGAGPGHKVHRQDGTGEEHEPALSAPPGRAQVLALCDAYFDHLKRRTFPGGCFFAGAVLEMGTRPGPVKERIAEFQSRFTAQIRAFIVAAIDQHELPDGEDPDALTFELNGLTLAANSNFVLRQDADGLELAKDIVHRRLGVPLSR